MQVCPNCGQSSPTRYRLCGHCGDELRPDLPREIRRRVTVLFSDLQGSTTLAEALDSEALFEVLSRYFDAMREPIERNGGMIEKLIGDAILAVFGMSGAYDDDPLRAVRAASECQAALAGLNDDLERSYGIRLTNRTGVATGEVVVGLQGPGEHVIAGQVLRLAMELEAGAAPMGVLVAESTRRAVGPAATFHLSSMPVSRHVGGVTSAEREPTGGDRHTHGGGLDAEGEDLGATAWQLTGLSSSAAQVTETRPIAVAPALRDDAAQFCTNCGEENPGDFRVCGTCGGVLGDAAGATESRKTVTIVFCDLRPSGLGGESLPADRIRGIVSRGFTAAHGAVERHGGSVEKFVGDALVAVFGLPVLHEDDGLRAVRAALAIQAEVTAIDAALAADGVRLAARIGVNTGLVVAGHATPGLHLVTGDAVNTAARLEQAAGDGDILLGDSTYGLVRDAVDVKPVGPLRLKGKAELVVAHRLIAVRRYEARPGKLGAAIVGRDVELAELDAAFREAVDDGPRLVTLLGDAGMGKSRMVREFERRVGPAARVYSGRCLAYGESITFAPIVDIIRSAAGVHDDDTPGEALARIRDLVGDQDVVDRLGALAGLTDVPFPLVELFWGIRRLAEILAAERPLVLVLDGVQWAEPALEDLLQHLLGTLSGLPILFLCNARHELLEGRPDWADAPRSCRITLAPLEPDAGRRMVDDLLGGDHRAVALRDRVVATSQGNPLFMEQLVQMLKDRGSLRQDDGRWVLGDETNELALPPTIQALLAARVDGLPRDEREIVQPAALVGYEFALQAIDAIVDAPLRPRIGDGIASLIGRQFLRPDPDLPPEEEGYRFRNQLIRDAAYQGLLKRARVILHERYVAWADVVNRERGRVLEFEEVLGYHLEQAYHYRTEFGPPDAAALAVGRDAARRLASAGRRSFLRGDVHAAASLLRRAASLLPPRDPDRLTLLPELGETLVELGQFAEGDQVLGEALAAADEIGDDGLRVRAMLNRLILRSYTGDEQDWARQVTDETERAMRVFERLEDHDGLARTWRLRFGQLSAAGRYGEAHRAAERVVTEAGLAGNLRLEARGAVAAATAALLGPTPVDVAIRECEELIARVAIDRRTVGLILCYLAQLRAMHGDFEAARTTYRDARSMLEELGRSLLSVSTSANSWRTEMLAGDPVAAEAELRRDYAALEAMGERYVLSTITGGLAQVVWAQGRHEEADELTRSAEALSSDDDVESQALWRSVRAKVNAHRGVEGAAELASEAVDMLRRTEAPYLLAEALVDLAETLVLAGRAGEAVPPLREALSLCEAKGDMVSARRVLAWLAALSAGGAAKA